MQYDDDLAIVDLERTVLQRRREIKRQGHSTLY